jgi:glucuronoarabinoxylan endo-1,4-beta-xylanase
LNEVIEFFGQPLNIEHETQKINSFALYQNYPNPFNPSTVIKYRIPSTPIALEQKLPVTLKIYDLLGREVGSLVDAYQSPGDYQVIFDISSLDFNLASGTYLYRLQAGDFYETRKMLFIK